MKKFSLYYSLILIFPLLLMSGCERNNVNQEPQHQGKASITFGTSGTSTRVLTYEHEKEAAIKDLRYAYGQSSSPSMTFVPISLPATDTPLPYTTDIAIEDGPALFLANFKESDISSQTIQQMKSKHFNFLNIAGVQNDAIKAADLFSGLDQYGFYHPKHVTSLKHGSVYLDVPDLNPNIDSLGHHIPMVADYTVSPKVTLTPDPSNATRQIVNPKPIMMERLFSKFLFRIRKDFTRLPGKTVYGQIYEPARIMVKKVNLLNVPATFSIDGPEASTRRVHIKDLIREEESEYSLDLNSILLDVALLGTYWDVFYLPETLLEPEASAVQLQFTVEILYNDVTGKYLVSLGDEKTFTVPLGERILSNGEEKYQIKRNTVHTISLSLRGWSEAALKVKYVVEPWTEKEITVPAFE